MDTGHKGFFLAKLEILIKEFPGGSHIVMEINPRVPGDIPLVSIRYKYRYEKVLGCVSI